MNQRAVLQLLRELIAIPSVNPSLAPEEAGRGGERELALFIGDWLRKRGIPVVLQEAAPGRFNVLGLVSGRSRGKTLMLNGHLDTVGTAGMAGAPFRAAFLKGKVYGRGSADMKGGLAAMLAAADALTTRDSGFRGQLLLAFVIDEEYLSIGTEKVLEQFAADGAIVAEPTDLVIGIAHKGFAWAGVTVFGKAAHGSRPAEGVDAIVKAGKFLAEVERYEQTVLFRKKHPLLGAPSLHASRVAGGRDWSTYPDRCRIEFERRTIPGENPANLAQELRVLIARVRKRIPGSGPRQSRSLPGRLWKRSAASHWCARWLNPIARFWAGRPVSAASAGGWTRRCWPGQAYPLWRSARRGAGCTPQPNGCACRACWLPRPCWPRARAASAAPLTPSGWPRAGRSNVEFSYSVFSLKRTYTVLGPSLSWLNSNTPTCLLITCESCL